MGRNVEENKTREIKAMSKPVNDNIAIIVFKALADESRLKIISIFTMLSILKTVFSSHPRDSVKIVVLKFLKK